MTDALGNVLMAGCSGELGLLPLPHNDCYGQVSLYIEPVAPPALACSDRWLCYRSCNVMFWYSTLFIFSPERMAAFRSNLSSQQHMCV